MVKHSTLILWVLNNKLEFWTSDRLGTIQLTSLSREIITLLILSLGFKMMLAKNQLPY
jgi:hypothetical protein